MHYTVLLILNAGLGLDSMPDDRILVLRPAYQGLGLGLETWLPRSWSWSRDLVTKVLVLVSRPGDQGLGLVFFSKVLITSLIHTYAVRMYQRSITHQGMLI